MKVKIPARSVQYEYKQTCEENEDKVDTAECIWTWNMQKLILLYKYKLIKRRPSFEMFLSTKELIIEYRRIIIITSKIFKRQANNRIL